MTHPIVAQLVALLDDNLREAWHERAAILEFDAATPRELAEAVALLVLLGQYPDAMHRCVTSKTR